MADLLTNNILTLMPSINECRLTLETGVSKDKLRSILVYGGFPLSAKHVVDGILKALGEVEAPVVAAPMPELQIEE